MARKTDTAQGKLVASNSQDEVELRKAFSDHPHQFMDRTIHAALAQSTGGVSPYSIFSAWSDWALHLSRSPGRQLEMIERAQKGALKLFVEAGSKPSELPFATQPHDNRFDHPAWANQPFKFWKQGFLAMQDWWNAATDPMPGLSMRDADRVRFQMRQMLDLVSPSNFPLTNPEIIEETARQKGMNLLEGTGIRHVCPRVCILSTYEAYSLKIGSPQDVLP